MKKFFAPLLVALALFAAPALAQQSGGPWSQATIGGKLYDSTHVGGSTKSVVGPSSAVDSHCVEFDGTTGALLKDAGAACGAGGGGPNVTDGTTTVTAPPVIDFTSGATVTNVGGNAHVAITGGGGGSAPLEQHTASTSATIDFTTGLTNACKVYFIEIDGAVPSTQADMQMQVSTDGGSTWVAGSAYDWAVYPNNNFINGAITGAGGGALATSNFVIAGGVNADLHLQGYLYGTQDSSITKGYNFTGAYKSSSISTLLSAWGNWNTTTVVNGLRFKMASGTINSGVFSLFCADAVGGSSGGSSGIEITDGSNDVTGATKLTITGGTVGGSTPNATLLISGGGGSGNATPIPSGRLTLQTGVPVMTADQANKTSVFYTQFTGGNKVPIWTGSAFQMDAYPNTNQALLTLDTHQSASNIYDIYAFDDPGSPGTFQICANATAWTSSTSRGAGQAVIDNLVTGIWTNGLSLTHCWNKVLGTPTDFPLAANEGTYLGTILTNGTAGHVDWTAKPSAASGGSAPTLGVYNAYNRVNVTALCQDSRSSWTNGSSTWVPTDATGTGSGLHNQVAYIDGLGASSVVGVVMAPLDNSGGSQGRIGLDFDSSSATPNVALGASTGVVSLTAQESFYPALGFHFVQGMEQDVTNGGTVTFFSDVYVDVTINGM